MLPTFYLLPLFIIAIFCVLAFCKMHPALNEEISSHGKINLDGFRGVVALLVCIHHGVIAYRYYFIDGQWVLPENRVYGLIGQFGVSGFFCLTGFLFWGKIKKNGMLNVLDFYKNRIRRILPAYVFSVCLLILFVFLRSDFCIKVSINELAKQIFSWFLMGINGSPDINGVGNTGVMNAFVFWTLKYEFYFYLSLPLLSLFSKPLHFVVVGAAITLYYTWYTQEYVVIYFIVGATLAYLNEVKFLSVIMKGYVGIGVLIISVFSYFSLCDTAYSWTGVIMSLPIMLAIFNGNSALGFLTLRPVRFLGVISYSLYVLHGLVIYVVYSFVSEYINLSFLLMLALIVFLSLLISTVVYLKIERAFINKRLAI